MLARTIAASTTAVRGLGPSGGRQCARAMGVAARFDKPGNPLHVVKMSDESVGEVGPNDVHLQMLAAPVSHNDLAAIETGAQAPGVGGNEGVAVVTQVGSAVTGLSAEDLVIPRRGGLGTWRSEAVVPAASVMAVPKELKHATAANLTPAMMAHRLLSDFAFLQPGDWIVQSGANSAVGRAVIQLARERGVRTVNLIRGAVATAETVKLLQQYGADVVASQDTWNAGEFQTKVLKGIAPKAAFDCVGGWSSTAVARALGDGGVLVSYGNLSRRGVVVPTSRLVGGGVKVRGFNFFSWLDRADDAKVAAMVDAVTSAVAEGKLHTMAASYAFDTEFDDAVKVVRQTGRGRRPMVTFKQ